jgi:hypothetical protein
MKLRKQAGTLKVLVANSKIELESNVGSSKSRSV